MTSVQDLSEEFRQLSERLPKTPGVLSSEDLEKEEASQLGSLTERLKDVASAVGRAIELYPDRRRALANRPLRIFFSDDPAYDELRREEGAVRESFIRAFAPLREASQRCLKGRVSAEPAAECWRRFMPEDAKRPKTSPGRILARICAYYADPLQKPPVLPREHFLTCIDQPFRPLDRIEDLKEIGHAGDRLSRLLIGRYWGLAQVLDTLSSCGEKNELLDADLCREIGEMISGLEEELLSSPEARKAEPYIVLGKVHLVFAGKPHDRLRCDIDEALIQLCRNALGFFTPFHLECGTVAKALNDVADELKLLAASKPILTNLQIQILEELDGNGLTGEKLAKALDDSVSTVGQPGDVRALSTVKTALNELTKLGLVKNKRGVGYYRPDKPPKPFDASKYSR